MTTTTTPTISRTARRAQLAEQYSKRMAERQDWLERGLLAIYARQTSDEQQSSTTHYNNGRGFSPVDADRLSYAARWVLSGKHLSGKWLVEVRERMEKYAGQLADLVMSQQQ